MVYCKATDLMYSLSMRQLPMRLPKLLRALLSPSVTASFLVVVLTFLVDGGFVLLFLDMPPPVLQLCCTKGDLWFLEFHAGIGVRSTVGTTSTMAHAEADNFGWGYPVKGLVHAFEKELTKILGSGVGRNVSDVYGTRR